MKTVLLNLAFLQLFATLTATGATEAEANAAVTDFCHERVYAEAIIAKLTDWLATAKTNVETTTADARKLQLAAARYGNTAKGPGFAALTAIATAQAADAAAELATKQPAIMLGLQVLTSKVAELATLEALTKPAIPQPTQAQSGGTTAVAFSGTVKVCQATVTPTQAAIASCNPNGKKHDQAKAIAEHIEQLTSIALRSAADVRLPTLTLRAEVQGTPDASHTIAPTPGAAACHINNGGTNNRGAADGVGLQAPTFKTGFTAGKLVFSTIQGNRKHSEGPGTEHDVNLLTADTKLVDALTGLAGKAIKPITRVAELPEDTILNDEATIDMLEAQQQIEGKELKETDKSRLAKQLFGGEKVKIKEVFFDSLTKDSVTIGSGAKEIKGTTEQLSKNHFKKAMAYYNTLNLKKTVAASKGAEPEEDTKTDAADKTEEKKGGDNKTATNTTGSNSVLIKKAPLLLAFLLF
ncbi:uncharacterized protein TEOVI_000580600 [Trypanosoma equiperdum]|uniref:Variant surface glycoprotein (VSG) n=1 Tax=Trypanosoma equiperdum TaxID=5694 RepID=A0A1G4I635_TRYEQ|nr:hypothetical protein, conserved [Trypanosoma equiperdum]